MQGLPTVFSRRSCASYRVSLSSACGLPRGAAALGLPPWSPTLIGTVSCGSIGCSRCRSRSTASSPSFRSCLPSAAASASTIGTGYSALTLLTYAVQSRPTYIALAEAFGSRLAIELRVGSSYEGDPPDFQDGFASGLASLLDRVPQLTALSIDDCCVCTRPSLPSSQVCFSCPTCVLALHDNYCGYAMPCPSSVSS